LGDLSREFLTLEQLIQLTETEYTTLDPRSVVLTRASLIDNLLERVLDLNFVTISRARFNSIFRDTGAPLSSFHAKIAVAHALGMFGDEFRSQIDRVRLIRNAFAHTMLPLSFDDELVAQECMKLVPARLTELPYQPDTDSPRERFIVTCDMLVNHLIRCVATLTAQIVAQGQRRRPWPDKYVPQHPHTSQNQG